MDLQNIKINGRYVIQNDKLMLFNSGSGISFKAKGKGFTINVGSITWPCYYYFILDRDYENKIRLCTTNNLVWKYVFDDNKEHLIDNLQVLQ